MKSFYEEYKEDKLSARRKLASILLHHKVSNGIIDYRTSLSKINFRVPSLRKYLSTSTLHEEASERELGLHIEWLQFIIVEGVIFVFKNKRTKSALNYYEY